VGTPPQTDNSIEARSIMSDRRDGLAERDIESQLRWLLDREAIRDVMLDYCRGVDRCDYGLISAAYHPDAYDDHGNFEGGPDAVVAKVSKSTVTASMHHIGNMRIELEGDTAWVETYFVAYASHELDGRHYNSGRGGRYLDRFEKRDGRWAIAHRKVADDWAQMDEVVRIPEVGRHQGRRSIDEDPWYSFRNGTS
jgi:ketosteroid isomerase-like protein